MNEIQSRLERLGPSLGGRVILPTDNDYDGATALFYGGLERRPAAVVRVASSDDVSRVVTATAETDTEVAVRSGGHSLAGHSLTDAGVVIDLTMMRGIAVDPVTRTAWAEGGVTAGDYTKAAAVHGLATGFGDTGTVGVSGITLGGGIGFLVREHGMTIDNLLAAEVVTADGRILRVDDENHPDLFWAIRGGGGNFGVATRLQLRMAEVDQIVGGILALPATPEVIAGFIAEAQAAPDALTTIANVMVAPPLPFVPEALVGQLVVFGILVYDGDVNTGTEVIDRFRSLAQPLTDTTCPTRYVDMFPEEEMDFHPRVATHNMFLDEVDVGQAAEIIDALETSTAPMRAVQLRALGGAMGRIPNDATAFAHRDRRIMANVAAMYMDPNEASEHTTWVKGTAGTIRSGADGAYIGFLGDEGEEGARRAYPEPTWSRLVEVKRSYDPQNLFRRNQNIPPG